MYKISDEYKNYVETKTSISPKCKISVDGIEYTGQIIKTAPKISHKNEKMIGGFPTRTCSFEIYDLDNSFNFLNKEIYVYRGIVINGTIEYIPQGIFIPTSDKIKTNISQKTISFDNIQDRTQLFDVQYESRLDWTQKHTGLEIVQEICDNLNIELSSEVFNWSTFEFPQPNFVENITYREVISRLAEIGGSIAFIDRLGKLIIKAPELTEHFIERKRYKTLSKENQFLINTVVLGKNNIDDDIVYPENIEDKRVEWKILDNPFVDLYREEMIENVSKYIVGKSIIPFEMSDFVDGFYFDLNDTILISDRNGKIFPGVILNYENSGRIKSIVGAKVQCENDTNYNIAGSNKQGMKRVQQQVDHINQKIISMAEDIEQYDEKISKVEQTVDEISQKVNEVADLEREITSNRVIHIPDAEQGLLLNLTINGELSYIYPENTLYPSNDLFPLASEFILVIDKTEKMSSDAVQIKLPFDYLGKRDKFIVEDSKAHIEKEDGTIVDLGEIQIPLFDGENYIHIKDYTERTGTMYAKYIVKNDYTDYFATKVELNTSITQTNEKIETEVNHVETLLGEQVEDLNSKITQTAEEISTEVSKKVGEDEIISKINQSAEKINIQASKIALEGYTTINDGFSVDEEGNMKSKNGEFEGNISASNIDGSTIKGGSIAIGDNFSVNVDGNLTCKGAKADNLTIENGTISLNTDSFANGMVIYSNNSKTKAEIKGSVLNIANSAGETSILAMYNTGTLRCVSLVQTSLAEQKKNFKKFDGALKIIKDIDIYKYNMKSEDDNHKKHIGFVIGDGYKYSSEITSVDENGKEVGVDTYSMTSLCLQAIKEQQKTIESLTKRIEILERKENDNNG